jgi:branched-chain amino acid transport system ATP-binding protein
MSAEKSKVTGVIGPNGAGKSTLLKAIYGHLKPKQGSIIFDGNDITGIEPHVLPQKGLVYIPQHRSLFPYLTVRENLQMGAWIFRKDKERVKESIEEACKRFPILKTREKIKAGRLSGGEQRMLELARDLMVKPKTMLVDEPTAGLAPKVVEQVYQKLKEIKEEGTSILLVDQNIKKALALSDYICVISGGKVTDEGPVGRFSERLNSLIGDWLL